MGGSGSFNGSTLAVIQRGGYEVGGFFCSGKIPHGIYSKLYVYAQVTASSSGSYIRAKMCLSSALSFTSSGTPDNVLKTITLVDASMTSSDINAQTGVTINSTDPALLSAQVVEVDISDLTQDFYIGFWNCDRILMIRSIYLE
jgi:hypothetical protein